MELITKVLIYVGLALLIALLYTLPIMWLWNWLMPLIFRLPELTFVQALGIAILSSLLFKDNSTSKS